MTIRAYIGNPRCGKTLLMTRDVISMTKIAATLPEKHYYFSNYHFLKQYQQIVKYITPLEFINIKLNELYTGVVTLDELWSWLESRGSGSNSNNKILSQIGFQSGKSGYEIQWSAQLSSSIDKRTTLLTDDFFCALKPTETAFRYVYVNETGKHPFRFPKIRASEYYPYFDTKEKIKPIDINLKKEMENVENNTDAIEDEEVVSTVSEFKEAQQDTELLLKIKEDIAKEVTNDIRQELQSLRDELNILKSRRIVVEQ